MKYIITLLLGLFFVNVYAKDKPEKSVTLKMMCYNSTIIFNELQSTYKEIPIMMGKTNDIAESTMSVWISPEKTWTIIATKDKISCIVGAGTDFESSKFFNQKKDTL